MESMHTKVAIIGSGPAGLTAAIYASRALLQPILIAGRESGGQLMNTSDVDNFPGFPDGINGPELMERMRKQAERFETKIIAENAVRILTDSQPFVVETESQKLTADSVILAMGANHKHLGLTNEERLRGKGVSYCATCDGFFFRNQTIAVVGGGDSAMEEASFLTHFANKVYLIHRRDTFRASNIMVEKVKANPKIELILDTEVKDILGDTSVTGLQLLNKNTGKESTLDITGLFVAVGLQPNSSLIDGQIDIDERGYIMNKGNYSSSVKGIFIAGDVHDHRYRQAITAAGFGCAAALEAERYLTDQFHA